MPTESQTEDGSERVMKALLAKLYSILMGGDATAPAPTNSFIAWFAPGVPVTKEQFAFADTGAIHAVDGASKNLYYSQAADFSRLVNIMPDASGVIGPENQKTAFKKTTFEVGGGTLWDAYSMALNQSEVADGSLSDQEKAKIEKFRGFLRKTVKNIVTEEDEIKDGPVMSAYLEKRTAYENAVKEYNAKRISALNSDSGKAVDDWALNESLYRSQVSSSYGAWVSGGYKNEVDQINAYIDQVTRKDLTLMKAELLKSLELGKMSSASTGDFYATYPVPAGFATAKGWTNFTFDHSNAETYYGKETNAWDAKVDVHPGVGLLSLLKVEADSSGKIDNSQWKRDVKNFKCSFDMTQVLISRAWFSPLFLTLKAWRFKEGRGNEDLSDGKRPPKGRLIGFPTACVFVRDVVLDFDDLHTNTEIYDQHLQAGLNVSYGPFATVGGKYERGVHKDTRVATVEKDGLHIPGMQLIALKCQLLPKAPDPAPTIKDFAG